MSETKSWYLVSYDVRNPKRLTKVANHLGGYGTRIQYSIFRCRMNDRERERLSWEMKKLMAEEDSLLIVGICNRCSERIKKINEESNWPEDPPNFEIV
jgi:CRISPR-associated protein Cas2